MTTNTAPTVRGTATIEPGVSLTDLNVGDLILGAPTPDLPVRTLHRVIRPYGRYRIPLEQPATRVERILSLLQRRHPGILVDLVLDEDLPDDGPFRAMFTDRWSPTVDRVTSLA